MRLANFIESNTERILEEWVAFAAATGPAGKSMDLVGLRDHALEMLRIIVIDLRTPQTHHEQQEKSKGNAPPVVDGIDTAAEVHGADRAESGFTLGEMVSEYRALRASVIRLWTEETGQLSRGDDLEDLMRFNEAIDQALAESVTRYTLDLDHSKDMFIAILGHDLRTPLNAVIMSSEFMVDAGELKEPSLTLTSRILRSARSMNRLVADLLDFTRTRLGTGVPIVREKMDMGKMARNAVDETAAAHPESRLELTSSGSLEGQWDCPRMTQVVINLLSNAVQHGSEKTPIRMTVDGLPDEVVICVHNQGPTIPASEFRGIFDPIKRLKAGEKTPRNSSNLGLGLYIAEQIVVGHGGTIGVSSTDDEGTSFTLRLPRDGSSVPTHGQAGT